MALSDRIAVFHAGRLQQYGSPREVYERPANLFVADFMGLVNKLPAEVLEVAGGTARARVGPHVVTASLPAHDPVTPGRAVVAVRPESIRVLTGAPDDGPNSFEGTVADATFLGNLVDYQIDIGGVLLRVQADRHLVREVGSKILLKIPVSECVAMSGEVPE